MFGRLGRGFLRPRRVRDHAGGPRQDGGPELPGIVHPQVGELDGRFAGVCHLELEFCQSEDPGQQWLDDVDGLDAVQPGLPLLAEQEAGVDPDVPFGDLVLGEIPGQDEAQHGHHQHDAAAGHQPGCAAGEVLLDERTALQHPFENVPPKEESNGGQRYPAAHKRRRRVHPQPLAVGR